MKKGMAKAKVRLRGRVPKLKPAQQAQAQVLALLDAGEQTPGELAELFV